MRKTTTLLVLLGTVLLAVLVRDLLPSRVRAEAPPALTARDVERIVRALERSAEAQADTAKAVREAGRACSKR
jgi:hypothetical protein